MKHYEIPKQIVKVTTKIIQCQQEYPKWSIRVKADRCLLAWVFKYVTHRSRHIPNFANHSF